MRRQLNVKLLAWTFVALLTSGVGLYLLHGFQVRRSARALLALGDHEAEQGRPAQAMLYYTQYLSYEPTDLDALAACRQRLVCRGQCDIKRTGATWERLLDE